MITITEVSALRNQLTALRSESSSISLVPTMGNLHAGHLELVRKAKAGSDIEGPNTVVCSIFVNPLQFGENEDLENYPRTLDADKEKLEAECCDILFLPSVFEIYGNSLENQTLVHVPKITEGYCSGSRPGHFDGVATVVCKLFNLVQPESAYFGLKDYQQFLTISKLAQDLCLNIRIIGVETQRAASGLALSSRNNYLNEKELQTAALIYANLETVAEKIRQGEKKFGHLESQAIENLRAEGMTAEYFSICNAKNLKPANPDDSELVILAAAQIGPCRLIDNVRINLNKPKAS